MGGQAHPSILFPIADSVCAGTTLQSGGCSYSLHTAESDAETRAAASARRELLKEAGFNSLVTLRQTHSDIVTGIDAGNLEAHLADPLIEGDGLITSLRGVLMGVLTADRLPVFFTDRSGSFAGIAHAGRAGVEKGIHLKLAAMAEKEFGVPPGELLALIGPHIRVCCYEVGPETADGWNETDLVRMNGKIFMNLENRVVRELTAAGIPVTSSRLCTRCSVNPPFWSYRAGHRKERMLSFIGIRG